MQAIRLYWWKPTVTGAVNLGDEINKDIVEFVSGREVVHEDSGKCDLIAIGSVLHAPFVPARLARRTLPLTVWGSGLMSPQLLPEHPLVRFAAVRGPLTRETAGLPQATPLGDPGVLVSERWPGVRAKRYAIGFVPHHKERQDPKLLALQERTPNSLLIDPTDPDFAATLAAVSACERIVSTSLHGLIVADAYEVPNVWLNTRDSHKDYAFKFYDYFASVRRRSYERHVMDLATGTLTDIPDEAYASAHFPDVRRLKQAISRAFPQELVAMAA